MFVNRVFRPHNLERNILIFEMTLDGFSDQEISHAMKIKAPNLTYIRKCLFEKMTEPARMLGRAPASIEHTAPSLRAHANFWRGRIFAYKVEMNLIDEKTGVVCN